MGHCNLGGQRGVSALDVIGVILIAAGVSGLAYQVVLTPMKPLQSPNFAEQKVAKPSDGSESRSSADCSRAMSPFELYEIKTRISEVILVTSACRTAVTEQYQLGDKAAPPTPNGWGCEAATQQILASVPDVKAVETDKNGVITVSTAEVADLCDAADKTIVMVPLRESGTPMVFARDAGTGVAQFRCSPGGGSPMDPKFLPGSCR